MKNLILLLSTIFCLLQAAQADVITLTGDHHCPYVCDPRSGKSGFIIDLASDIFASRGHRVRYIPAPWGRAIQQVRKGLIVGLAGVQRRDVPDLIYPDNEQAFMQIAFFANHHDAWRYTGIASLFKVTLGITHGRGYGEMNSYIDKYKKTTKIFSLTGSNTTGRNIALLAQGRFDVMIEDSATMAFNLKLNNHPAQIKNAGRLSGENLYIAFSPKHPKAHHYARLISMQIPQMRRSGQLADILKPYGLSDWKIPAHYSTDNLNIANNTAEVEIRDE